jgi:WD40 repeat protein
MSYTPTSFTIPEGAGVDVLTPDNATRITELAAWKVTGWWVDDLAFLPGGDELVVMYGQDNGSTIALMSMTDGSIRPLEHQGNPIIVSSMALAPGGNLLATGTRGPIVQVWSIPDGELLHTLDVPRMFAQVAFAPDGRTLATSGTEDSVLVWDAVEGTLLRTIEGLAGKAGRGVTLAFSPDGQHLAIGLENATVQVWNVSDGRLVHTLSGGHKREPYAWPNVAFSPDGRLLVSASSYSKTAYSNTVFWQTSDGTMLRNVQSGGKDIAFSPDGQLLAGARIGGRIWVRRVSDGATRYARVGHFPGRSTPWANCVAFSPDGTRLASGGGDGMVRVWGIR